MGWVMMSERELNRIEVLAQIDDGRLSVVQTQAWPDERDLSRRTRQPVYRILKNPNRRTKPVMGKIIEAIKDLPLVTRPSITFDRGSEFMNWPHLQVEIGTQTWFCYPSSPWRTGTVENTNRRARRWLPRKRDIRSMTDQDMKEICDRLNNTPRKCLGWKTPSEAFREKMLEEMQ